MEGNIVKEINALEGKFDRMHCKAASSDKQRIRCDNLYGEIQQGKKILEMIDKANEDSEESGEAVDGKVNEMMQQDSGDLLVKQRAMFVNNNCMNRREMRRNKDCQELKVQIDASE